MLTWKWVSITWDGNDMIKLYYPICLCFLAGLLHPSWITSPTSIEWQLLKSVHKVIFSREWPSYLQLKQLNHKWTLRSSAAMQLEIPLVVSHICQDQDAKSLNTVNKVPYTFRSPECVRNCIDFSSLKWLLGIWWKRSKITIQLDVVFTLHC